MRSSTQVVIRRQTGVHPALVDLAFVLAFLFLILSTLAETNPRQDSGAERALPPIDLPELDSASSEERGVAESSETVSLLADGSLLVGESSVANFDALSKQLQSTGVLSVLIRVEREVPYGRVAELLGLCQSFGIEEVSLSYEKTSG